MAARSSLLRALVFAATLLASRDAGGQCAAQASTCAACHATSPRAPVRHGDAPWHKDHTAGDFCAGCHGGDAAQKREAEAHAGLVEPLADPARSCAPCHDARPFDLAQRYAAALAERGPAPPAPRAPASRDALVGGVAAALAAVLLALVVVNERRRRAASVEGP